MKRDEVEQLKRYIASTMAWRFSLRAASIITGLQYAESEELRVVADQIRSEYNVGIDSWSVSIDAGDYTGTVMAALAAHESALCRQTIPDLLINAKAAPIITLVGKAVSVEYPWPKETMIRGENVQLVYPVLFNHLALGVTRAIPIGISTGGVTVNAFFDDGHSESECDAHSVKHMLVAGTTGSGKTTAMQAIVTAMAIQRRYKIVLLDGKGSGRGLRMVEGFAGVVSPTVTDIEDARVALKTICAAMVARYKQTPLEILPPQVAFLARGEDPIVVMFDEFPDWISDPDIADSVGAILRKGREARVFLIMGTQNPDGKTFGDINFRRLLNAKLVFCVNDAYATRMALGGDADSAPAHMLPMPGAAYFVTPGIRERITTPLITGEMIDSYMIRYGRKGAYPIEHWQEDTPEEPGQAMEISPQEAAAAIAGAHLDWGRTKVESARGGLSLSAGRFNKLKEYGGQVLTSLADLGLTLGVPG